MGGVPTEERFQNISQEQWLVLLNHYFDKKSRQKEEILGIVEYLALLVSMNPKGVQKIIKGRLRQKEMEENSKENPEKYLMINKDGINEFGQHVNTTFFDTLKEFGGEDAIKALGEQPVEYKVMDNSKEPSKQLSEEDLSEDEKFILEAKRSFAERERELEEEAKFKKEHPELFEGDTVVF